MEIPGHAGGGSGPGSGAGEGAPSGSAQPEVVSQMSTHELDARIREILHDEVAALIRAELPELFGSIKTAMVEYFDERYAALTETAAAAATAAVAAAGGGASRGFQYRDFDNTKPPTFDGVQDPIVAMRWLSDVEGCFFTCSCPADQRGEVCFEPVEARSKGLVEIDHGIVFGCAEGCDFMGSVQGDVQYSLCSTGREGEVGSGVLGAKAGFRIGDGNHQDVY